jgi:hypothetical protein
MGALHNAIDLAASGTRRCDEHRCASACPDFAPDGQAYLFLLAGTIQCFVKPKGGL